MRLAPLFLLAFICGVAHATQTSRTYVLDWVIGDSENRVAARKGAIEEVRRRASEEAGIIVRGREELNGDSYESAIETIAARLVQTKIISESATTGAGGESRLSLVVRADIDNDELKAELAALRADAGRLPLGLQAVFSLHIQEGNGTAASAC